jgi:hypothetical protein
MTDETEQALEWPDNIVADRHEVSSNWVIHYATDEQAKQMSQALQSRKAVDVGWRMDDVVKFAEHVQILCQPSTKPPEATIEKIWQFCAEVIKNKTGNRGTHRTHRGAG